MSLIQPLSIPDAAAVDYAGADVRHFAPNDGMSVPAISGPTRQLAHRDNVIGNKVNELVSVVNNREQYVNIPILRTILPPSASEIVNNYRIPAGFEARVFNAAVASTPAASAQIEILYGTSYGGTTGESLLITSTEFSDGTEFKTTGEFIVKITNTGTKTAEISASVTVTMRPLSPLPGTPISPGIKILAPRPGPPGRPGDRGLSGPIGASVEGQAGLRWQGSWSAGTYNKNDGVFYSGSAYISLVDTNNVTPGTDPLKWSLLAQRGDNGTNVGGLEYAGVWTANTTYNANDVVVDTTTNPHRTFLSTGTVLNSQRPSHGVNGWVELFGPSYAPSYTQEVVNGSIDYTNATSVCVAGTITAIDGTGLLLTVSGLPAATSEVIGYAINAGGTGYSVGNTITLSGGTGRSATFSVAAVSSGVVTALTLLDGGSYTAAPSSYTGVATTVSPAGGTGLTINVQMHLRGNDYGRAGGVVGSGYMVRVTNGSTYFREIVSHTPINGSGVSILTLGSALPGGGWTSLAFNITLPIADRSDYQELPLTGTSMAVGFIESVIETPISVGGVVGFATITGVFRVALKGKLIIRLPYKTEPTNPSRIDWVVGTSDNSFNGVNMNAASNGPVRYHLPGVKAELPQVFINEVDATDTTFILEHNGPEPVLTSLFIYGTKVITTSD